MYSRGVYVALSEVPDNGYTEEAVPSSTKSYASDMCVQYAACVTVFHHGEVTCILVGDE